jgi:hypothetical protein
MQRPGLAECPYPVSNKNIIICAIYTAAKIMSIRSIHGTTVFAHPKKGFLGQIMVLTRMLLRPQEPLVHRNSTYSNAIERVVLPLTLCTIIELSELEKDLAYVEDSRRFLPVTTHSPLTSDQ